MNKIEITKFKPLRQLPASSQQGDLHHTHSFSPSNPKVSRPRDSSCGLDLIPVRFALSVISPIFSICLLLYFSPTKPKPETFIFNNRYLTGRKTGENTQVILGTKIVNITTIDIFKITEYSGPKQELIYANKC